MGEHDGVEMRQAAIPEERGNRACARRGFAHAAGVVEHRPARGELDEHRAAVADAEESAVEPAAVVPPGRCGETRGDPHGQQCHAPTPRRAKPGKGDGQSQRTVEAPEPPIGRPGQPEMATRHSMANVHGPFQQPETSVAQPAAEASQRRTERAEQQHAEPAQQAHRHQRPEQHVGHHPRQRQNVKSSQHQRQRQHPKQQAGLRDADHAPPELSPDPRWPGQVLQDQTLQRRFHV